MLKRGAIEFGRERDMAGIGEASTQIESESSLGRSMLETAARV